MFKDFVFFAFFRLYFIPVVVALWRGKPARRENWRRRREIEDGGWQESLPPEATKAFCVHDFN
jgi:hypothetical protein